jgi:hypothetical protein
LLPIFDGSRLSHFYIVNFAFPYNAQHVCIRFVASGAA